MDDIGKRYQTSSSKREKIKLLQLRKYRLYRVMVLFVLTVAILDCIIFAFLKPNHQHSHMGTLPLCPDIPPNLNGRLEIITSPVPTVLELEQRFSCVQPGGHWCPNTCTASKKVAIIVPFRNSDEDLLVFLQHMHPFLQKQQLDYTVFVLEQEGTEALNKGTLMNVGFKEALKIDNFDCFIFHDVHLLPEDDRNLYTCTEQPRHMTAVLNNVEHTGTLAFTAECFKLLNGFSNCFWDSGPEHGEMEDRIKYHKLHVLKYPTTIARYFMHNTKGDTWNTKRYKATSLSKHRFSEEGLSSLSYTITKLKQCPLYTWFSVSLKRPRLNIPCYQKK